MSAGAFALLLMNLAGGLAFFVYGMKVMSEGLQALAGSKLRDLLFKLTRNRLSGYAIGNLLGLAIHSGAATILLVSFINAGMLSLEQSIAVMLGSNVGTTLSMQLISFKVGKYALAAIGLGMLGKLAAPKVSWRHGGAILFGFGLLFLGMDTMSAAAIPLKEAGYLEAVLAATNASTTVGFGLALLLSIAVTLVFQSSGATIGVLFALCGAGVFTDIRQLFPLIIGAHVGTCSATLIGAVGTNIEARRSALSHLLFNALGTVAAVLMMPLYLWLVPLTSSDITRQVANTHTLVQFTNSLLVLPIAAAFAAFVRRCAPSKEKPAEPSWLDESALAMPEQAICNAMRESRRMAIITRQMLVQAMSGLLLRTSKPFARVVKNEHVVDTLKRSINAYLIEITNRRLSTRQSILLQHLMTTASDLERVGDHIEDITQVTSEKVAGHVWFDEESMKQMVEQYRVVDRLLRLTILSLDPDLRAFKEISQKMLELRREFIGNQRAMRARYRQLIIDRQETPINGIYYERFLRSFERIVRHTKSIARVEQQDFFFVKPHKFSRKTAIDSKRPVEGQPIAVEEGLLNEELAYDDLGIDPTLLSSAGPKAGCAGGGGPSAPVAS
jgi:phosphate:Na+ symporter